MKERPILFSAPMVRAILAGAKTQTRRVFKQATGLSLSVNMDESTPGVAELSWLHGDGPGHEVFETVKRVACPYGQLGDRLWVREAWRASSAHDDLAPRDIPQVDAIEYAASQERVLTGKNRPSMFMPRWASRITLEITGVRVELLQDISEADAIAEGINVDAIDSYKRCIGIDRPAGFLYRDLWMAINGQDSWGENPWVWVVEFKRVQ